MPQARPTLRQETQAYTRSSEAAPPEPQAEAALNLRSCVDRGPEADAATKSRRSLARRPDLVRSARDCHERGRVGRPRRHRTRPKRLSSSLPAASADELAGGVAGLHAAEEAESRPTPDSELVPVSASVFDDEFFRNGRIRTRTMEPDPSYHATVATAQHESEPEAENAGSLDDEAREVPQFTFGGYAHSESTHESTLFAGATGGHAAHVQADELDIPAFLRRSRF